MSLWKYVILTLIFVAFHPLFIERIFPFWLSVVILIIAIVLTVWNNPDFFFEEVNEKEYVKVVKELKHEYKLEYDGNVYYLKKRELK